MAVDLRRVRSLELDALKDYLASQQVSHQVILVPVKQGQTQIIDTPGFKVRGWIAENYSMFDLYLNYSTRVPGIGDPWDQRVEPFFKESETVGDVAVLSYRLDTAPDGSTAQNLPNQYVRLTLLSIPVAPISQSMVGPTVTVANTVAAYTPFAATGNNANAVISVAGIAGKSVRLATLRCSYSAAPTGGRVTISDGTTTMDFDIPGAGPFDLGEEVGETVWAVGATLTITLFAGGVGITGKINASARVL